MKPKEKKIVRQEKDRQIIFEMINASISLAARKGKHALERGCNCIACVNKRKRYFQNPQKQWKYRL